MQISLRKQARRRAAASDLRPLRRMLPYLLRYRAQIAIALIALLSASIATMLIPVAVRRVLDKGFIVGDTGLVNSYFLTMLGIVAILAISSATRMYYVMWLGERIVADIRDILFRHLTKLTPSFYERQQTGEILSRLTTDTNQIRFTFSTSASIALRNAVMLIGSISMMIYTSPKLSGVAALAIPVVIVPIIIYGRKVRGLSRAAQDALADAAAYAQERLGAIGTVQSNGQEPNTNTYFAGASLFAFNTARKRTKARAFLTFFVILVATGSIVGLLWMGAQSVISGSMSAGMLGQFIIYAVLAASSLGQMSEVWGEIQLAAGAAERVSEILDEEPAISSPASPIALPKPAKGHVEFENVSFRYPSRPETAVLDAVSFTVNPGETVALVGPSGAGKTTIFSLLERFYDPLAGSVKLDGLMVNTVAVEDLRSVISAVPQDPVIFSGTIAENIKFSRPEASDDDMRKAAIAARVDEFAARLPSGYNTLLGERGMMLSGGQRQRVAIARAILRNTPVLLLDEATSALDAESESLVQEALEQLTKNRTTLVIAHRLATVRHADRIIVLDKGKIVGQGTHSQLQKKSPLYAKLAKLQFNAPST